MTTRTRGAMRPPSAPGVTDLAARLRSTLSFFATRPFAAPVSQVMLTGAGCVVEGMQQAVSAAIDIPSRIVSATDVVAVAGAAPAGEFGLNLVSTIGIATGEVR